ncbi:MAG: HD domain-containing phosphohydrolase [Candidatus Omnitrophota bacterium]
MPKKIEGAFREFTTALQTAKLYAVKHPIFKAALEKAFFSLQEALGGRPDFTIGIVGDELACGKEIFFELTKLVRPVITYIKERGIEKITFYRGLTREELEKFIDFLAAPKAEMKLSVGEYFAQAGIRNIFAGKLQEGGGAVGPHPTVASQAVETDSLGQISQTVESVLNKGVIDQLSLGFIMNNVLENLGSQFPVLSRMPALKQFDAQTFTHLVNVSILSMYFSSKLGLLRDDVTAIGIAGLFHDIGKIFISRRIIRKDSRLTDEEHARIENHAILGCQIMLGYADSLGALPAVVSFEHHLKYNLKGYPRPRYPRAQHLASMIVTICDVYDALCQRRSYRGAYPPDMVYNLMIKGKGEQYHPELLEKFFACVGVWPVGSILALSDERTAVVVEQSQGDISLPKVKIISPENSGEIIDLSKQEGKIKIQRYLNPAGEGKEFLHLV